MNSEKEYIILIPSTKSYLIYYFIGYIIPIVLSSSILIYFNITFNSFLYLIIPFGILIMFMMIFSARLAKMHFLPIKIKFNNQEISFEYLKKDFQSIKYKNCYSFDEVKSFYFGGFKEDSFSLHFKDNFEFKLSIDSLLRTPDDFVTFRDDFRKFMSNRTKEVKKKDYNKPDNNSEAIKENMLDNSQGYLILAFCIIILFVSLALFIFGVETVGSVYFIDAMALIYIIFFIYAKRIK